MTKAKPFLKWAGGKTQLIKKFQKFYPNELKAGKIDRYIEPFLGSGAVFFDIAQNYKINSAFLCDINEELILTFQVVQKNVEKLIDCLEKHKKSYYRLNKEKRKEYFYKERKRFNQQKKDIDFDSFSEKWINRAAQIIFLNKTCYNGLFRMNSKGEFNSPVGSYSKPQIIDAQNLLRVAKLLKCAEIIRLNFSKITRRVTKNSFVYFDPPYRPLNNTAHFTSYSTFKFNEEQQYHLAELFKVLDKKKAKLMLSNSDPKNEKPDDNFFDNLYQDYHIHTVTANRMINSNKDKRGEVNEILVLNY